MTADCGVSAGTFQWTVRAQEVPGASVGGQSLWRVGGGCAPVNVGGLRMAGRTEAVRVTVAWAAARGGDGLGRLGVQCRKGRSRGASDRQRRGMAVGMRARRAAGGFPMEDDAAGKALRGLWGPGHGHGAEVAVAVRPRLQFTLAVLGVVELDAGRVAELVFECPDGVIGNGKLGVERAGLAGRDVRAEVELRRVEGDDWRRRGVPGWRRRRGWSRWSVQVRGRAGRCRPECAAGTPATGCRRTRRARLDATRGRTRSRFRWCRRRGDDRSSRSAWRPRPGRGR